MKRITIHEVVVPVSQPHFTIAHNERVVQIDATFRKTGKQIPEREIEPAWRVTYITESKTE